MASEFLSVPGNVKQIFLPFVLDPGNAINSTPIDVQANVGGDTDTTATGITGKMRTQLFTFRANADGQALLGKDGKSTEHAGFLRIAPDSFYGTQGIEPSDDISYKLLYGYENGDIKKGQKIDPLTHILNNLPRITIREYLMDAKLDQLMNIFSELGKGWDAGANAAKVSDDEARRSWLSKLYDIGQNVLDSGTVLIRNFDKAIKDIIGPAIDKFGKEVAGQGGKDDDYLKFVVKIPYILYYKMLSSTSTNIYEIPYSGTVMYESDGRTGWVDKHLLNGVEASGLANLGGMTSFIGKNIKVNTTPTWDGASDTEGIKVETEFTLFNDSLDGAVKNFIFVNTLIPGNMWMQYHLYQHAPNLYDIRIEGVKRLYMCAGSFKCEQLGVLRSPSKKFINTLVSTHMRKDGAGYIKSNIGLLLDQIKIPDAYKITCTFTSLLPNNFNNYLYTYYGNGKIVERVGGTGDGVTDGIRSDSCYESVAASTREEVGAIWAYPALSQREFDEVGTLAELRDRIATNDEKLESDEIWAELGASTPEQAELEEEMGEE